MIVKPSINFVNQDSDAELIKSTHIILAAMTDNPSYPNPTPGLDIVTAALSEFTTAVANAADGGMTLTAIKNQKREALAALLRNLASYVTITCDGNLATLLSSGFPAQKSQRTPATIPVAPTDLIVSLGILSGELDADIPPVYGAATYNWQLFAATAPTLILQREQTTGGRTAFKGLTPGVIYGIQVNAVGSAGTGDWSNPTLKMVV